jgi:hypothetical protein
MSIGAPPTSHLESHRAKRGPRWPGPGRYPGPRDDRTTGSTVGRPARMPGDSIAAHRGRTLSPRWLRAAPTQHIAPAQTRSTAEHRVSPPPDPRTDDLAQPIIPLSPSLALSLSSACQGIRDSHNHRSALVDASTRALFTHHPALYAFADIRATGQCTKRKAKGVGGQIAIALYHSRSRTASARNEGSGDYFIASTDRARPALRIAGCPIQPTTIIQGRKFRDIYS